MELVGLMRQWGGGGWVGRVREGGVGNKISSQIGWPESSGSMGW